MIDSKNRAAERIGLHCCVLIFSLASLAIATASEVEIVYDPQPLGWLPSKGDRTKKKWYEDHGSINKILGDTIQRVQIRYFSNVWKNAGEVRTYLRDVLSDARSKTYEAPVWDQSVQPSVECIIWFRDGKQGVWVWQGWTSCFQDSSGKYWFATHQDSWHQHEASKQKDKSVEPTPIR